MFFICLNKENNQKCEAARSFGWVLSVAHPHRHLLFLLSSHTQAHILQHLLDLAPISTGQMKVQNSGSLTWPWKCPLKKRGEWICSKNSIISVISSYVSFFQVWACWDIYFFPYFLSHSWHFTSYFGTAEPWNYFYCQNPEWLNND